MAIEIYEGELTGSEVDALLSTVSSSNISATHKITRSATLVIAASNSSAKVKAQADYVCDGTDDQEEINTAIGIINAVGGGRVILLEGIYYIGASIVPCNNLSFGGTGWGSVRLFQVGNTNVIAKTDGTSNDARVIISDIIIVGDANATSGSAIYIDNQSNFTMSMVYVLSMPEYGIYIGVTSGSNHQLYNVYINGCGAAAYYIGAAHTLLDHAVSDGCLFSLFVPQSGSFLQVISSHFEGASNNGIQLSAPYSSIIGSKIITPGGRGVYITADGYAATFTGNLIYECINTGIDTLAPNTKIIGNTIKSINGIYGININPTAINSIAAENILSGTGDGRYVVISAPGSSIINNQCAGVSDVGIELISAPENIRIENNNIDKPIVGARGNGDIIKNNIGYITENTGTATITAAATTVNVIHGLAAAPTRVILSPTTATGGKDFYVSAKDATTFTITIDTEADEAISFDWQAVI
ncbi:MAG: right-handed parallel beta-helix repeat-containing protein [Bacteroidales bacterium]|nr:right-handed parallel beta-helix repeat-containing protein [Bacteroidales bacterium]